MNSYVAEAARKLVAAVDKQDSQSIREAVESGWKARDEVIIAAHAFAVVYKATSTGDSTP